MSKSENGLNVNLVSRISEGTVFRGEILSDHDLRIDGKFEGALCLEGKVVIGETAEVDADITCTNVDVRGKAKGRFTIKDVLSVKKGCSLDGDLMVRKLEIELDSSFNGTCKMISEQEYQAEYNAKVRKMQGKPAAEPAKAPAAAPAAKPAPKAEK